MPNAKNDAPDARSSDLPETPWALEAQEALESLSASPDGLSEGEVDQRRERYGPNRLREAERRSTLAILWDQVKSLIMLLLVAAAIVSLLFQEYVEALAIGAVIVLNTMIGFVTEFRAVRSMEALQKMGEVDATVRRGGEESKVSAADLVPGDIVLLDEGDVVPADLRLIEVDGLDVDESALTGESVPVAKEADPVDESAEIAERNSMAFRGTAVARGSAVGLVVATGMQTELGSISEMVESAEAERTPLEKKLDQLGRKLVWLTVAVAAAVSVSGILAGRDIFQMVQTGIALAVAAIPEGLPIVATVALSYGMWIMVRHNALVRRLSSVETLGATTLICTDKTGTLTENQMVVRRLELPSGRVDVEEDELDVGSEPGENDATRARHFAVRAAVLCNDASIGEEEAESEGDPMEQALLQLGRNAGLDRDAINERFPRKHEVPFDRETKMMATYHKVDDGYLVAVKGAPEAVLEASTQILSDGGPQQLTDELRRERKERNVSMAEDGLRVISVAHKIASSTDDEPYEELCFLGHIGLLDPPRENIREIIGECQQAGIRVVMVTGDQIPTARHVADAVGLSSDHEAEVVHGRDFPSASEASEEDRRRILDAAVFARVSPRQKLDLIDLHQANGEVVAMTGDGVNDAPALRSADIGVAMGQRGTEVAQEAADMVLLDDAFSSIVTAIEQGRVIFNNIRKFVVYLLSGNVGEILAVGVAAVFAIPLPLLPLQILYINMLNDVFPALALGMGRGTSKVMEHPPRDPEEDVITGFHWGVIVGYGALIAGAVLGVFVWALFGYGMETTEAVTISFISLSVGRLLHVFNMRDRESGFFDNEITRNPYVWGALALCVGLLMLALYLPVLADVLGVTPPSPHGWMLIAIGGAAPLILGQIYLRFVEQWIVSE